MRRKIKNRNSSNSDHPEENARQKNTLFVFILRSLFSICSLVGNQRISKCKIEYTKWLGNIRQKMLAFFPLDKPNFTFDIFLLLQMKSCSLQARITCHFSLSETPAAFLYGRTSNLNQIQLYVVTILKFLKFLGHLLDQEQRIKWPN